MRQPARIRLMLSVHDKLVPNLVPDSSETILDYLT
jgi:hypothetical protein